MTYAICDFVKGLLPGLKKETVLEDLRISIDIIDKTVVPALDKITTVMKDKFKSKHSQELENAFKKSYKGSIANGTNMLITLRNSMGNIRQNAEYVEKRLSEILESTIVPDGLTSRKAAMIRASKQVSFITDMTLDVLNVVLILETVEQNSTLLEDMEVSKGTALRVQHNIARYAYAVSDFNRKPADFEKLYEKMKDVFVGGANAANVSISVKETEIDPFDSRMVQGVAYNPLYHARIAVAQWQASRYHASKEKKKVLELRVLQLKAENDNKQDPRILKEINYTQSRIDKFDREIHDTEDELSMA